MSEAFTAKLHGSVYFSPALQPHFMCVELKVTVLVWRCNLRGLGKLVGRVLFLKKHPIRWQSVLRSGRSSFNVGSWKELKAGRTSWNLLKPIVRGLTGIMPAPEQPCSPASSHGRLRFRPVIVTTAHAQSSQSSPFSVGISCYLFLEQHWLWATTYVYPESYPVCVKPRQRLASDICSD